MIQEREEDKKKKKDLNKPGKYKIDDASYKRDMKPSSPNDFTSEILRQSDEKLKKN